MVKLVLRSNIEINYRWKCGKNCISYFFCTNQSKSFKVVCWESTSRRTSPLQYWYSPQSRSRSSQPSHRGLSWSWTEWIRVSPPPHFSCRSLAPGSPQLLRDATTGHGITFNPSLCSRLNSSCLRPKTVETGMMYSPSPRTKSSILSLSTLLETLGVWMLPPSLLSLYLLS